MTQHQGVHRPIQSKAAAIVTGGARGMGLACATRLANDGAAVAIVDLDESAARSAAAALPTEDNLHIGIAADVTVPSDVRKSVDLTTETLGTPTRLINCAGLAHATQFLDISEQEWATVVAISLTGPFLYAQACLPGMIKERWGRIVNFSSTAGKSVSTLGGAHYTAAKTGLLGLTRAIAKEFGSAGITVNAVCPGLIDTPMAHALCSDEKLSQYARSFPVGRLGKSEEVADLVAFLCSDSAAYITGAALDINGGDLMV